jgi:hypothetical protein
MIGSTADTIIPKKIFQTWENKELPQSLQLAENSWKQKNKDWNVQLYDSNDRRNFIATHFSDEVLWAYDQLIPGAYQADLWRYCILYIEGGVYADIKLRLLLPLPEIIDPTATFVTVIDKGFPSILNINNDINPYLMQGFLASKPNHIALKKAINEIVNHVKEGNYSVDYLSITGPGLLGRVINRILNREPLSNYKAGCYKTGGDTYQLLPVWDTDKKLFLDQKNRPFISRHCSGYRKNLNYQKRINNDFDVIKGQYGRCWYLSSVYYHGRKKHLPRNSVQEAIFKKEKKRAYKRLITCLYRANEKDQARHSLKFYLNQYGLNKKITYEIFIGEVLLIYRFFKKISSIKLPSRKHKNQ